MKNHSGRYYHNIIANPSKKHIKNGLKYFLSRVNCGNKEDSIFLEWLVERQIDHLTKEHMVEILINDHIGGKVKKLLAERLENAYD